MTDIQPYNTLLIYASKPTLAQYLLFNLFRVLKPIRKQYQLTVTDCVILIGCYNYHCLVDTSFTIRSLRGFIVYYTDNKLLFHVSRLVDKGFIVHTDIISKHNRYKVTEKTIELINRLDSDYDSLLYSFIDKYSLKDR